MDNPRIQVLQEALLSLYDGDVKADGVAKAIHEHYTDGAEFIDPWTKAVGKKELIVQFQFLRTILSKFKIDQPTFFFDNDRLLLEGILRVEYLSWTTRVRSDIKMVIICHLDKSDVKPRIKRHEDMWSLSSVFQNVPIAGNFYDFAKRTIGYASSIAIEKFYKVENKIEQLQELGPDYFLNSRKYHIYTLKWTPEKDPKALVFILHGAGEHCQRYDWVASQLVKQDYAVYAMDHQGHGRSGGPRHTVDDFNHYVDDYLQYIDTITTRHPDKPIFLLGHSMGGAITVLLAQRRPKAWRGVYLSAPFLKPHPDHTRPGMYTLAKLFAQYVPDWTVPLSKFNAGKIVRDKETADVYSKDELVNQGNMNFKWGWQLIQLSEAAFKEVNKVEWPFFVATGTMDLIISSHGSTLLYENASSKDKKIQIYNGLYHEILNEPERELVFQDLLKWFDERV